MNLYYPNRPSSIRVVAKVRPSASEDDDTCIQVASAVCQIVLDFDIDNFYDFDGVFAEDTSQHNFFNQCLGDLIVNFFQGYNTSVLTYGQQGSGKTFTMIGPHFMRTMSEEDHGLLPRAVKEIFKQMSKVPNRKYRVHVSYITISEQAIYDLLSNGLVSLNIMEDNEGNVVLPGITTVECHSISEVLDCLEEGLLVRHSTCKKGFDLASAHTLFNFTLEHNWKDSSGKSNYICSRLSFVDLAGSEGHSNHLQDNMNVYSNAGKNNFALNPDLQALSNVIFTLTNKNGPQMIPYTSSRLTHLLKDSIGGNSQTLMVCCLSPLTADWKASYNTIQLGCLTRYIINYPRLNAVTHNLPPNGTTNNNNNTWNSTSTNSTIEVGPNYFNPQFAPNLTAMPQLSLGLPPNLQVVQAGVLPMDPIAMDIPLEENPRQENEDIFKVKFAATQWHQLVSSAEDLLVAILYSETTTPSEKSRIRSWLCMKAETDECIGPEMKPSIEQLETSRLEVIEELSEPSDDDESLESEISSSMSSLGENFCYQLEQLKDKFLSMTSDLIRDTERSHDVCEFLPGRRETGTEILRTRIENMIVDTEEEEEEEDDEPHEEINPPQMSFKDEDNLALDNYGSDVSLLSIESASAGPPSSVFKRTINKTLKKTLEKLPPKSKMENLTPAVSSSDFVSGDDDDDSSGNELLRRFSSKLVSVSKGSSKCVNSFKSKSFQLKRSIRRRIRIFNKRPKNNTAPLIGIENPKFSNSSELKPCSMLVVSNDLKAAEDMLKILNKTIQAKEELVAARRQKEPRAETCQAIIEKYEAELHEAVMQYENSADENEDEKKRFWNEIRGIQKKKKNWQKVSSFSTQDDFGMKQLEESIKELRQKQEELQTKLRLEVQRRKMLEEKIHREDRASRNVLNSSKLLDDESEDGELEDLKYEPPLIGQSKKRKLVNSTGDSQSETHSSWRGRARRKAGRLDFGSDQEVNILVAEPQESEKKKQFQNLRTAKMKLVAKRQRIYKQIEKEHCKNGREKWIKFFKLDEAVEGLDAVMELKHHVVSDNLEQFSSPLLAKFGLEDVFRQLPLEEVYFILIFYFNRLVDLRYEFRKQEKDYANLEEQFDDQTRDIKQMEINYQHLKLEKERQITSIQMYYELNLSQLCQLIEDTTGVSINDLLEKLKYYKNLSLALKKKLEKFQGPSRAIDPGPGPSGLQNTAPSRRKVPNPVREVARPSAPWHRHYALPSNPLSKVTRSKLILQK